MGDPRDAIYTRWIHTRTENGASSKPLQRSFVLSPRSRTSFAISIKQTKCAHWVIRIERNCHTVAIFRFSTNSIRSCYVNPILEPSWNVWRQAKRHPENGSGWCEVNNGIYSQTWTAAKIKPLGVLASATVLTTNEERACSLFRAIHFRPVLPTQINRN